MTKLNWNKARRPREWSFEASPYRPVHAFDILRAEPPRVKRLSAITGSHLESRYRGSAGRFVPEWISNTVPAAVTLAFLAGSGINRLSIWCRACRKAEHRSIDGLAADVLALPIEQLSEAVRCSCCGGPTTVSPFTESPARHVG